MSARLRESAWTGARVDHGEDEDRQKRASKTSSDAIFTKRRSAWDGPQLHVSALHFPLWAVLFAPCGSQMIGRKCSFVFCLKPMRTSPHSRLKPPRTLFTTIGLGVTGREGRRGHTGAPMRGSDWLIKARKTPPGRASPGKSQRPRTAFLGAKRRCSTATETPALVMPVVACPVVGRGSLLRASRASLFSSLLFLSGLPRANRGEAARADARRPVLGQAEAGLETLPATGCLPLAAFCYGASLVETAYALCRLCTV